MDSPSIWQTLEMDFSVCQNKQCFSARGSHRAPNGGIEMDGGWCWAPCDNLLPPHQLQSSLVMHIVHIRASTHTYAWTKKHTQIHIGTNKSASLRYPAGWIPLFCTITSAASRLWPAKLTAGSCELCSRISTLIELAQVSNWKCITINTLQKKNCQQTLTL